MFDNGNIQRDKLHDELASLREEAIARLERRGYEVEGKRRRKSEVLSSVVQKRENQPKPANKVFPLRPLWVRSRHVRRNKRCLLYAR